MTYGMLLNMRVIKCKVASIGTGHFTELSSCIRIPNYPSCCKEAEDNLPTEGMSRPGGVAAKCHQPSLLSSDIN